jgi:hypothetical protein
MRTLPVANRRCSVRAHHDASSRGTQAISSNEKVGTSSARDAVTVEPSMPPIELPTAMKGNRRLPWLLSKQSAIRPQNTVTTKSAKTLVQT